MAKILVVDLGNTRCKVGLFEADARTKTWNFSEDVAADIANIVASETPEQVVVSNVGGMLLPDIHPNWIHIDYKKPLPIQIKYQQPADVGADRIANACAVFHRQEATMVIDAGTCITYDVVAEKTFVGGAISPGLAMRLRAMHQQTQLLPRLNVKVPEAAFPFTNTADNMQGAAYHGVIAEIDHFVALFKRQYPLGNAVITGGDAAALQKGLKSNIFAHPNLTLQGIYNIYKHQYA